ncbi:hypothetical protein BDZ45DRAFT_432551 [Acephala macrosclerotiorum]|nr:hypothetical protein BDZ45DRAFT_432551 [Acephala macrosclerotiorum]
MSYFSTRRKYMVSARSQLLRHRFNIMLWIMKFVSFPYVSRDEAEFLLSALLFLIVVFFFRMALVEALRHPRRPR